MTIIVLPAHLGLYLGYADDKQIGYADDSTFMAVVP